MIAEYIGQTQHIVGSEKDIDEYLANAAPIIGDICFSDSNSLLVYNGANWITYDTTPTVEPIKSAELIQLTCKCCGAPVIRKEGNIYTCEYCGTTYLGI